MNESIALAKEVPGRKLETLQVSADEPEQRLHDTDGIVASQCERMRSDADSMMTSVYKYVRSLWLRGDNTTANASRPVCGALDVHELIQAIKIRG